ncbi:MAG: ARMT1-like domain-containing protein [Candidatus Omnitrophica bacterium]|nr:ARMT1-like domain-containing protein [Candidatus Omnitrophota bacterium]MCF7892591.1 ARMT1-like domain-containing protein [Candidatus Omnitrophota bacterium]
MKTYLDCIPCFFKQALDAARLAKASEAVQREVLISLSKELEKFSLDSCPPQMGKFIYNKVREITKKSDPYKEIKKKSNKLALSFYPKLKDKVKNAKDPLLFSLELAIAGNIIDYGVKHSLDVDKELDNILAEESEAIRHESKAIFNYPEFKNKLAESNNIIYLGDNAGEIVFDKILIEQIKEKYPKKDILYVVKEKPIINDALAEDAYMCGIDKYAKIISSGCDSPGTILSICAKDFLDRFKSADMVISKGQGNFEALYKKSKRPVFFLFMAKCPVVAKDIGSKIKDIILLYE